MDVTNSVKEEMNSINREGKIMVWKKKKKKKAA